jgi:serine/threonine protein kinase
MSNNIAAVLGYAEDIIKGIAYMHDQLIMHRDIKPSNIMFKPGPRPTCKLIDFNLSKRLEGEKCYTEDVGTDGFQAPEVLNVDVDLGYDFKSDIYSYGLTIKELSENCPKVYKTSN